MSGVPVEPIKEAVRETEGETGRSWPVLAWVECMSDTTLGDLRVLVMRNGDFWHAQGLEVGYGVTLVSGLSKNSVTEKFEERLRVLVGSKSISPRVAHERYWDMAFQGVSDIGWTSAGWLRPWFSGIRFYEVRERT